MIMYRVLYRRPLFNLNNLNILRYYYSTKKNELIDHLKKSIRETGPISIAQYMREVLTNSLSGYYMTGDVFGIFGRQGDFVTSPEISQIFGELMGIWFLTQWQSQGKPDKIQVVELGPGRGTLLYDMLNAISSFSDCFRSICEVHLIEISSKLREIQYKKLCSSSKKFDGLNFFWHDSFNKISDKWSMIIAHEFFDALPIHLFECTSNGWREVLVDIDDTKHSLYNFRLIVASVPTKASIALTGSLAYRMFKIGDRIEISPDSMEISKQIANHIKSNGGASLIIDYGQDFIQGNTLRAIKHHEFVHPLSEPGQADLSADVNFCYLKESVTNLVEAYGPITQSKFLQSLGIKARLLMLLKSALYTNHKDLISSTERLVHPSAMGEIYKVLAFVPKGSLKVPIAFEKSNN